MSVCVAMKFKGGVILAADRRITAGQRSYSGCKIWSTRWLGLGVGAVGSAAIDSALRYGLSDLMRPEDILDGKPFDIDYVSSVTVPMIFKMLKDNEIPNGGDPEYLNFQTLVCDPQHIFEIGGDRFALEHDDFAEIGCGQDYVHGYLANIYKKNMSLKEATDVAVKAIQNSCGDSVFIGNGIDMIVVPDMDVMAKEKAAAKRKRKKAKEKKTQKGRETPQE